MGLCILSVIVFELSNNECAEIVMRYGEFIVTILGYIYGIPLFTYDGIEIGPT